MLVIYVLSHIGVVCVGVLPECLVHVWINQVASLHLLSVHLCICRVVKEELAEDEAALPNVKGRVVCWVSLWFCMLRTCE